MGRLRAWLLPPPPGAEPRSVLEWARRMEVTAGVSSIASGLVFWNAGWWHWLLLGIGVAGVSPWFGVGPVLRKADRDPDVLRRNPARGRAVARRFLAVMAVGQTLLGGALGYLLGGWSAAIATAALMALGSALGALVVRRRWRAEDAARNDARQ